MKINYELHGRCLWHEDCEKARQGIMGLVRHEEGRSLVKCLHCGRQGYYPVGGVGPLEVEEVVVPTSLDSGSPVTYRMLGIESDTPDAAVRCNCLWDGGHESTCHVVAAHKYLKGVG